MTFTTSLLPVSSTETDYIHIAIYHTLTLLPDHSYTLALFSHDVNIGSLQIPQTTKQRTYTYSKCNGKHENLPW